MRNITKKRKKKIIIYSIIFLIFIGKMVSLNIDKIDDFFCRTRYEMLTKKYHQLSSYKNFLDREQEIDAIFFGSTECPHCVKNIKSIDSILDENKQVYYFMVKFDDYDNQKDLEEFKKRFNFDTIPHIVLFTENGEKQYSSKDIARYSK